MNNKKEQKNKQYSYEKRARVINYTYTKYFKETQLRFQTNKTKTKLQKKKTKLIYENLMNLL